MKFLLLIIFGLMFNNKSIAQDSSFTYSTNSDSFRLNPFNDLLPPEFKSASLENEYHSKSDSEVVPISYRGLEFVLRLRDNCTFIYETFSYKSARIEFYIGKYIITGDTIYLTYESLLPGHPDKVYLSPTTPVSWILPPRHKYLLINKNRLFDPSELRLKKKEHYTKR
jgi:hypothetical protein